MNFSERKKNDIKKVESEMVVFLLHCIKKHVKDRNSLRYWNHSGRVLPNSLQEKKIH